MHVLAHLWNEVGQFLQFQHLEIYTLALVGHDKEWIQ